MPPPSLPFYPPDASISITSYKTTFTPPSHTKHHGSERQVPQFIPSHIESDRDPRATEERRMRRNAHRDAIERDPNVFKGKKNPDSFKNFVEEAKIMKAMLGDSRQVRDPYDRGEHYAYSYSRNGPEIDNRPDCYDVDDAWFMDRTRGYSPGNVRSLSPPPKGTNRWMQTLSHVDSTCNFEEQTERQNTQQPVLSTRYSTIQLGKEWSKFRSDRYKKNVERKEEGERAEKHRGVMKAEKEEQERVIAGFEKRLRAMAEPGSNRKQGTDSDSDSDEEEEEEEGPRVPRDEQGEGGERPSSR